MLCSNKKACKNASELLKVVLPRSKLRDNYMQSAVWNLVVAA